MMLHAKAHWPSTISVNLWPYDLRLDNDNQNYTSGKKDGISPMDNISQIFIQPKIKAFHSFGCLVYSLKNKLKGEK